MYKILMMIQVIIMKILAKCKFGSETMIRQFAKFSLPPKLVVVRYTHVIATVGVVRVADITVGDLTKNME